MSPATAAGPASFFTVASLIWPALVFVYCIFGSMKAENNFLAIYLFLKGLPVAAVPSVIFASVALARREDQALLARVSLWIGLTVLALLLLFMVATGVMIMLTWNQ